MGVSTFSRKAVGAGRPGAATHLQDGNLPLQRATLLLQEGPGTRGCGTQSSAVGLGLSGVLPKSLPPASPGAPCRPSFLSPPHPLLPESGPSPAWHLPASSWAGCVLFLPPSQRPPQGHHSLFCMTVPHLQVLLLHSLFITALPLLKNSSAVQLSPTPQNKSPQAKAPAGTHTWLLPGSKPPEPRSNLAFGPLSPTHLGLPSGFAASLLLSPAQGPHPQSHPPCLRPHHTRSGPSPQVAGNLVDVGHVELVLNDAEVPVTAAGR